MAKDWSCRIGWNTTDSVTSESLGTGSLSGACLRELSIEEVTIQCPQLNPSLSSGPQDLYSTFAGIPFHREPRIKYAHGMTFGSNVPKVRHRVYPVTEL